MTGMGYVGETMQAGPYLVSAALMPPAPEDVSGVFADTSDPDVMRVQFTLGGVHWSASWHAGDGYWSAVPSDPHLPEPERRAGFECAGALLRRARYAVNDIAAQAVNAPGMASVLSGIAAGSPAPSAEAALSRKARQDAEELISCAIAAEEALEGAVGAGIAPEVAVASYEKAQLDFAEKAEELLLRMLGW